MYSKQQAAQISKNFWTSFGQYMRPLPGAEGEEINWLNYKTGIRHVYFRMDADKKQASIAIELRHPDISAQHDFFTSLQSVKNILQQSTGEEWEWQLLQTDDDGKSVSRIRIVLEGVNIYNTNDWPSIISFLKPRIIALDEFWSMVKDGLS